MKKLLLIVSLFMLAIVSIVACKKKTEDVMDRQDGKWTVISNYSYYIDGILDEEGSERGSMTFDGSNFTYVDAANEVTSGSWSATKDKVTLIVNGDALIMDIIESKKKSQEWRY